MEKTPLELYESAYKLHYIEKKFSEAVSAYEQLISEFPDSNECGYAAIQLQKIKIGSISGKSAIKHSSNLHPIAMVALIIGCISLIGCGAITYYFKSQISADQHQSMLAINALAKIIKKDNDGALKLLNDLKTFRHDDIIPFELSADIYRKNHLYKKAYLEYELFFRLNPIRQPSSAELEIMNSDKEAADSNGQIEKRVENQREKEALLNEYILDNNKKRTNIEPVTTNNETPNNNQATVQKSSLKRSPTPDSSPSNANRKNQNKPQSAKAPVKGLFIVDPDSLSYF